MSFTMKQSFSAAALAAHVFGNPCRACCSRSGMRTYRLSAAGIAVEG